jgi:hypothetical protein
MIINNYFLNSSYTFDSATTLDENKKERMIV